MTLEFEVKQAALSVYLIEANYNEVIDLTCSVWVGCTSLLLMGEYIYVCIYLVVNICVHGLVTLLLGITAWYIDGQTML